MVATGADPVPAQSHSAFPSTAVRGSPPWTHRSGTRPVPPRGCRSPSSTECARALPVTIGPLRSAGGGPAAGERCPGVVAGRLLRQRSPPDPPVVPVGGRRRACTTWWRRWGRRSRVRGRSDRALGHRRLPVGSGGERARRRPDLRRRQQVAPGTTARHGPPAASRARRGPGLRGRRSGGQAQADGARSAGVAGLAAQSLTMWAAYSAPSQQTGANFGP
jgi:hypothetical protein